MSEVTRMLEVGYTLIWRANRLERALEGLPDDFEWVVPGHPEGPIFRGREGVIEFFREWTEPFDDLDAQWELHDAGADRALALIQMRGRGHESGAPVDMQFGQLWTFRDGRAVRMEMFSDIDEARRAAGIDPPATRES
jgi:ketosteroid isomerase-like protein